MRILLAIFCMTIIFTPVRALSALSEGPCATLVVTNLKTINPRIDSEQEALLVSYWTQICKGILDHIKAAAVVNTTVTGVTGTGPAGGPLPITLQPGVGVVN